MLVYYGVHHFRKIVGHYGPKETCPHCGNLYQKDYIRQSNWAHIYYIPFFPAGSKYFKVCPVCYSATEMKSKDAKEEMNAYPPQEQVLVPVTVKHTVSGTYDLILEDRISGASFPLLLKGTKSDLKQKIKNRCYKNVETREFQD